MRKKNLDLIATTSIAALNVLWALLPFHSIPVIGIILALPLVLVLPGYTLTEALFTTRSLNASERFVFGLGLSLAITVLGGFVLNLLPGGLQPTSWAVLLGLFIGVFALVAAYRRQRAVVNALRPLRFRLTIYQGLLFALATIVVILSVLFSVASAEQQRYPGFTQFWMLPAGQSCAVRLGVHSFEATPAAYRVTMTINTTQTNTWSSVMLAPQAEWEQLVPVPLGSAQHVSVEAQLYRLDKPQTLYRKVDLTFRSLSGGGGTSCVSG